MKRFKPAKSERALAEHFTALDIDPDSFTVSEMVDVTLHFYERVRASRRVSGPDSDMMLFEWGTFDWGNGAFFQISMTRQFLERRLFGGDPRMSQLRAIGYFAPNEASRALGRNHFWCHDLSDLHEFREKVLSSPAYEERRDLSAHRCEILWDPV